jgi:hypothetical protein
MSGNRRKRVVSTRISAGVAAVLQRVAETEDRSVSSIVRRLLEEWARREHGHVPIQGHRSTAPQSDVMSH